MYRRICFQNEAQPPIAQKAAASSVSVGAVLDAYLEDMVPSVELRREAAGKRKRYSTQVARSTQVAAGGSEASRDSRPASNPWFLSLLAPADQTGVRSQTERICRRRAKRVEAEEKRKQMPSLRMLKSSMSSDGDSIRSRPARQAGKKEASVPPKKQEQNMAGCSAYDWRRFFVRVVPPLPIGIRKQAPQLLHSSTSKPPAGSPNSDVLRVLVRDAVELRRSYLRNLATSLLQLDENDEEALVNRELAAIRHFPLIGCRVRVVDLRLDEKQRSSSVERKRCSRAAHFQFNSQLAVEWCDVCPEAVIVAELQHSYMAADYQQNVYKVSKYFADSTIWGTRADLLHKAILDKSKAASSGGDSDRICSGNATNGSRKPRTATLRCLEVVALDARNVVEMRLKGRIL